MSKLNKVYTLNMCSLVYVNYISVAVFKNTAVRYHCTALRLAKMLKTNNTEIANDVEPLEFFHLISGICELCDHFEKNVMTISYRQYTRIPSL